MKETQFHITLKAYLTPELERDCEVTMARSIVGKPQMGSSTRPLKNRCICLHQRLAMELELGVSANVHLQDWWGMRYSSHLGYGAGGDGTQKKIGSTEDSSRREAGA